MALEPVPLDSYCAWWWSLLLISLSVYCMSVMDSPDGTRTCSPRLLLCLVVESTSDLSLYTVCLLWTPLMALEPVSLDSYCAWWWSLLLISLCILYFCYGLSPDGTRTCSPRLLLCLVVESTSDLSPYTVCLLWTPLMALEPVSLDSYCAWWWSLLLISLCILYVCYGLP